jgi:hypothetical protein
MFQIYNFNSNDFISGKDKVFNVIKSDTNEFQTKKSINGNTSTFSLEAFQDFVEVLRLNNLENALDKKRVPKHYERKTIDKKEFVDIYNSGLLDLKLEYQDKFKLLGVNDIDECFSLIRELNHILTIAKTKDGYLSYMYTA